MIFASFILSITSGDGLQTPLKYLFYWTFGFLYSIRYIIFSYDNFPFSRPAHNFILFNVTGNTFPLILNISEIFSTAFAKLPVTSVIAAINTPNE